MVIDTSVSSNLSVLHYADALLCIKTRRENRNTQKRRGRTWISIYNIATYNAQAANFRPAKIDTLKRGAGRDSVHEYMQVVKRVL